MEEQTLWKPWRRGRGRADGKRGRWTWPALGTYFPFFLILSGLGRRRREAPLRRWGAVKPRGGLPGGVGTGKSHVKYHRCCFGSSGPAATALRITRASWVCVRIDLQIPDFNKSFATEIMGHNPRPLPPTVRPVPALGHSSRCGSDSHSDRAARCRAPRRETPEEAP